MAKMIALILAFLLGLSAGTAAPDTCVIALDSNPTTGYTWHAEIREGDCVTLEDEYGVYTQNEAPAGMSGVGGVTRFTLKAVCSGTALVYFSYERSWEEGAASEKMYQVTVDENLYVTAEEVFLPEAGACVIALDSNPTTGYQWTGAVISGDCVALEDAEGVYTADETDEMLCGVGGVTRFTLNPVHSGYALVSFTYARSWEEEGIERELYAVTVDGNGTITAEPVGKTLKSVCYSCSGDENGNVYEEELKRDENDVWTLTVRKAESHDVPVEVKVYAVADGIQANVENAYFSVSEVVWQAEKGAMEVCDAAQPNLTLVFETAEGERQQISLNGYSIFTDGEDAAYGQILQELKEAQTEENLVDSYEETEE